MIIQLRNYLIFDFYTRLIMQLFIVADIFILHNLNQPTE